MSRRVLNGRNQQMIKVGPSLIRDGWSVDDLVELFQEMFPDLVEAEIVKTCQSAARYAEAEGFTKLSRSEYIARRRRLQGIEDAEARALPDVLRSYEWRWDEICLAGNGISEMEGIPATSNLPRTHVSTYRRAVGRCGAPVGREGGARES